MDASNCRFRRAKIACLSPRGTCSLRLSGLVDIHSESASSVCVEAGRNGLLAISGITQSQGVTADPSGSIASVVGCTTSGVYVGDSMAMDS
jgi:hypothetical protein